MLRAPSHPSAELLKEPVDHRAQIGPTGYREPPKVPRRIGYHTN
jgi:hypothetical protein